MILAVRPPEPPLVLVLHLHLRLNVAAGEKTTSSLLTLDLCLRLVLDCYWWHWPDARVEFDGGNDCGKGKYDERFHGLY